jgi:hypothetical protein
VGDVRQGDRAGEVAEPKAVALALEGMKYEADLGRGRDAQERPPADPAAVRADARQVGREGGPKDAKVDMENSGLAPVTDARMEAFTSA